MFGRDAGHCALNAYDGFKALEKTLIATGYTNVQSVWVPRSCPTGISGQTCLSTGTNCSLHNYGIAVDIDPFGYGNPHFQRKYGDRWDFSDCKFTKAQVDAVEAIKNVHGEQFFRWLGWAIGDTMHFELQVHPTRTAVNWDTVPGGIGAQMFCTKGDKGPVVAYWQIVLKYHLGQNLGAWGDGSFGTAAGDGVDGSYGDDMATAVKAVARSDGQQIGPLVMARIDRARIEALNSGGGSGDLTKAQADTLYQPINKVPAHGHDYAAKAHGHKGSVIEKTEVTLT